MLGDNDDKDFEEFKRRFMRDIQGSNVNAVDMNALSGLTERELREFEQMLQDVILPMIMAGQHSGVTGINVIRPNAHPQLPDPDSDLSWLDKYLK